MFWRWLAMLCAIIVMVGATDARAQTRPGSSPKSTVVPPGSTPVLTFESDDAEEQAEAFTSALRAKIKSMPGWTLSENTFSLGILTAALKCRMDAPCLLRVADQLKTDKFFWGRVARVGKTQVSVEAHYWQRGKHDSVVREAYSDDLRDPANETLKKIAGRVFERLTGTATTGTVAVAAGRSGGLVIVDGSPSGELNVGKAVLELKAGQHVVEVRAQGYLPVRQTVNVVVGAETQLSLDLVALGVPAAPPPPEKPAPPVRRIAGYSLIGAGLVAGAIGIVYGVQWLGMSSDHTKLADQQYGVLGPKEIINVEDACTYANRPQPEAQVTDDARRRMAEDCKNNEEAGRVGAIGWIAGGAGIALAGAGVLLLYLDTKSQKAEKVAAPRAAARPSRSSWSLTPVVTPREGSVRLGMTF